MRQAQDLNPEESLEKAIGGVAPLTRVGFCKDLRSLFFPLVNGKKCVGMGLGRAFRPFPAGVWGRSPQMPEIPMAEKVGKTMITALVRAPQKNLHV
jgi:hypothetical protein